MTDIATPTTETTPAHGVALSDAAAAKVKSLLQPIRSGAGGDSVTQ
jgi:hypothetical protein